MFPSNSTDWSIPYGDNDDRFYNYTGGDWFGNVTGWNSTNGEYDGFYNFTGKDFMPGGYGEYDTPWPQANGSASGEPPYGDQPPFGSYGVLRQPFFSCLYLKPKLLQHRCHMTGDTIGVMLATQYSILNCTVTAYRPITYSFPRQL
jgi:hypothetical protein